MGASESNAVRSISCPHCGRVGRLPADARPKAVKCPGCSQAFSPDAPPAVRTQQTPAVVAPPPVPAERPATVVYVPGPSQLPAEARACDYCGETILATAKKCKHCGELLDPAMRHAELAMRAAEASRAGSPPSVVIRNTAASHAQATAAVLGGERRKSLLRSLAGVLVLGVGLMFAGFAMAGGQASNGGAMAVAGLGGAIIMIGVPVLCFRGLWRLIFG